MFKTETVFVLGAGASWHYGYPTGEALVEDVTLMASRVAEYCNQRKAVPHLTIPDYVLQHCDLSRGAAGQATGWEYVEDECQRLVTRLNTVKPLVMEHFLAWNPKLAEVGKLLIAGVILECEARWFDVRGNQNRITGSKGNLVFSMMDHLEMTKNKDKWDRFLIHGIMTDCFESADLLANRVRFITFNYDFSLENALFESLGAMSILDGEDVRHFLENERIVHVYGSVHNENYHGKDNISLKTSLSLGRPLPRHGVLDETKILLDKWWESAKEIRIMSPNEKSLDAVALETAKRWLINADNVYILGYGFDEDNNKRIGLDQLRSRQMMRVMFTNYNDHNSEPLCFSSRLLDFLPMSRLQKTSHFYAEKSTRNVYDAIALDFGDVHS